MDILVKDEFENTKDYQENKGKIDELIMKSLRLIDVDEETPFFIYYYWGKKKDIIKDLFHVEWHSPDELNPDLSFINEIDSNVGEFDSIDDFVEKFETIIPGILSEDEIRKRINNNVEHIKFDPLSKEVSGCYNPKTKTIYIRNNKLKSEDIKRVLFHEFIHALTYNKEKELCGFTSVYRDANMLDESLVTILETEYRKLYQPREDKIIKRTTNGYFFYSLGEALDYVYDGEIMKAFFQDPNRIKELVTSYQYNIPYFGETKEASLEDFGRGVQVLRRLKCDPTDVFLKRMFRSLGFIKDNIAKNPEETIEAICDVEAFVDNQVLFKVLSKENFSLDKISHLFKIQKYPNYEIFYQIINASEYSPSELNNYPELKKAYELIYGMNHNDYDKVKDILKSDNKSLRYMSSKISKEILGTSDYSEEDLKIKSKCYYSVEAAVLSFANTKMTLNELLTNVSISKINNNFQNDSHRDFYHGVSDILVSLSDDFLFPIYFVKGEVDNSFVYDNDIFRYVTVKEAIDTVLELKDSLIEECTSKEMNYSQEEIDDLTVDYDNIIKSLLKLNTDMVYFSEDRFLNYIHLDGNKVKVYINANTSKEYDLSEVEDFKIDLDYYRQLK